MKRAEDFRKFTELLHPLSSSIEILPEPPDDLGVEYLQDVNEQKPIAENPYEASDIREDGLKIWDSVFISTPKSTSLGLKRAKDITSLRSINLEWETTKESLNMIGRPDGIHCLRPKGEFILDLMVDDLKMLQGAHILAHREPAHIEEDDYTFGQTADNFLRNMIKLFLARKYNLLVNIHPEKPSEDSFSLYGIEIFGSTDLRAPTLFANIGEKGKLKQDKTVIAVLGSIGIEAHPKQAPEGCDKWKEINKWSCLPTLVTLAGWECVDYITHTERVELRGEPFYATPCSDLQEMSSFKEILETAEKTKGYPEAHPNVLTVEQWFRSEDFSKGLSVTPQLPCPYCLRINEHADGVVKRPRTKKPSRRLKEIEHFADTELVEWVNYVNFMRNCITIGRKATTFALRSITTVKKRNSQFANRLKLQKKIQSLEKRYISKMSNGYITEAESLLVEIEKITKQLEL